MTAGTVIQAFASQFAEPWRSGFELLLYLGFFITLLVAWLGTTIALYALAILASRVTHAALDWAWTVKPLSRADRAYATMTAWLWIMVLGITSFVIQHRCQPVFDSPPTQGWMRFLYFAWSMNVLPMEGFALFGHRARSRGRPDWDVGMLRWACIVLKAVVLFLAVENGFVSAGWSWAALGHLLLAGLVVFGFGLTVLIPVLWIAQNLGLVPERRSKAIDLSKDKISKSC